MTTGYSIQIIVDSGLTSAQRTNLLGLCKAYMMIEHNELDVVITDLIIGEIKRVEKFTSNFLYVRQIQVSVLSVKGILDLPYIPALKTPSPIFSDNQAVMWGADNSLIANSSVPITVTYSAGYEVIPEDILQAIFEATRIFFDREDKLRLPDKLKAMKEYREFALSNYRFNALYSTYV